MTDAATDTTLLVEERDPGVVLVTLNRPERLNAQTNEMFAELERLGLGLRDRPDVRAVVVTGAGRGFCAGFDLDHADELPHLGALGMLRQQELAARAMHAIRNVPMPVIAAVNGAAAGGGLALALAADIRIATPAAKFNAAFVKIGLTAGDLGTSWLVPRLVGPGRAAEFVYTGRIMGVEEAERIGLVNRIVPVEALLDEALALAEAIAANSPGGVLLSKRALQSNLEVASYAAALELENRGQALLSRTPDFPEAIAAFREGRTPTFTGR